MKYSIILIILFGTFIVKAQSVPASEENIPFLVTFGSASETAWGDDDFSQTFFFIIPETWKKPFFIRIFDPETGGANDEIKNTPDSKTTFTVFGGKGVFSNPQARSAGPVDAENSGIKLSSKTFDNSARYDNKWFSLGPFNPVEGEYISDFKGFIFKIVATGIAGNDGNLYKYFLSSQNDENTKIEGGNAFTYEYSFRLWDKSGFISHIYPFINNKVVSIKIHTFDFDNDGEIRIVSLAKKSEEVKVSGDNEWVSSIHPITDKEKNTSLDIQIIKLKSSINNNVVFYITNQYGELLPFFTTPIGGIPKYPYEIKHRPYQGNH